MTEAELIEAEAQYLEAQAEQLRQRAKQLRELKPEVESTGRAVDLEAKLEALPWKEASSKKCDYAKDVPGELVEAVRGVKGGVAGKTHHFTAATDGPTLFRFNRGSKK